uniref:Uncharacterized protein LOC114330640 n=1 Tax=Diabrotica virgifera virgifera TaxID=50390 RepID=A0A6P7FIT8_DIAVI
MRSTPIQPIHVEASEPPLEIRRNLLSEKWVLKAHTTNFELFSSICHLNESDLTHKYWIKKPSPPLCTALQNNPIFSNELNTVDKNLDYFALFHKTDVIIPTYNENNIISNSILKSILNCYSDATVTYTDASKSRERTGCAYFLPSEGFELKYKLPNEFSIFSAESLAILEALKYIKNSYTKKR